jgi:hypothetical protein
MGFGLSLHRIVVPAVGLEDRAIRKEGYLDGRVPFAGEIRRIGGIYLFHEAS